MITLLAQHCPDQMSISLTAVLPVVADLMWDTKAAVRRRGRPPPPPSSSLPAAHPRLPRPVSQVKDAATQAMKMRARR